GWGVIIKEALANGRLTDRGDRDHLAALGSEAIARTTTIDALALAAALRNLGATSHCRVPLRWHNSTAMSVRFRLLTN
ncbi:MAG TPA: hypothetical protein VFU28_07520, partial [Vicinamibacterales bacterium]|nr:hypothetical protein [Vicinamibacterales bacterium]